MLTLSVAVLPEVVDEEHSGVMKNLQSMAIYDNSLAADLAFSVASTSFGTFFARRFHSRPSPVSRLVSDGCLEMVPGCRPSFGTLGVLCGPE